MTKEYHDGAGKERPMEYEMTVMKSERMIESCHHGDHKNDGCVKEILESILHAQKKVNNMLDCSNSCKQSINSLFEDKKKPSKNTIPFILYCGCEPFKGTGVTTIYGQHKEKKFACFSSFIFRVRDLEHHCVVLELLAFKPEKCSMRDASATYCSPCEQINGEKVENLIKTGICINVDISCFCGISCLPAVYL